MCFSLKPDFAKTKTHLKHLKGEKEKILFLLVIV